MKEPIKTTHYIIIYYYIYKFNIYVCVSVQI